LHLSFDFVQSALSAQNEDLEACYLLQSQGNDFRYAVERVAQLSGLEADNILKPGKQPARLYARSLLFYWAIRRLGMAAVAVSKLLGISPSAATRAAYRGEAIAAANNLELVEGLNAGAPLIHPCPPEEVIILDIGRPARGHFNLKDIAGMLEVSNARINIAWIEAQIAERQLQDEWQAARHFLDYL
jgi:hypothetical protein